MENDNMNYKKLISEYTRDQDYIVVMMLVFVVIIIIGLIIIHELSLTSLIVLVLFCLFLIALPFYRKKQFNDIYENLSEEEQRELDSDINQTYFFSGRDYALTSKYIINFKNPKIIKYSSILIIDRTTGCTSYGKSSHFCDVVYVFTKNEKVGLILKVYTALNFQPQYYEGLYSYIKAQNPNVLEGYTRKNRKIIEEKYNIKI